MMAPVLLHATTVAFDGKGVMLTGASGSGKSSLALQLMAIGAQLVADDQTLIDQDDGQIVARCPDALAGMIEARGIGLLHAPHVPKAVLSLVVDMDQTETSRLPDHRIITLLGQELPLVLASRAYHFPSALRYYVLHGRQA